MTLMTGCHKNSKLQVFRRKEWTGMTFAYTSYRGTYK